MERNQCVLSGCFGGCCQDITIYDAESTIVNTFTNATEVNTWQLKDAVDGKKPNGVYYQYDGRNPNSGMAIARIVGKCPNLNMNGSCNRYHRCSHAAEKFKMGSTDCVKIRN